MKSKLKSTYIPKSDQASPDRDAAGQSKNPTFHVQTGVRAGGFYDRFYAWWEGVAEGFNMADKLTQLW
jgi:hypothetical protein